MPTNSIFVPIIKIKLRAFPIHFASILYFTSSKSQFFILTTHFYKTPSITFFILQYIILKYYKKIIFLYIFFHTPTKPTASVDQPQPQQADQQQPPITPTPTPANPNPQPPYPRRQTQTHHNPFCLQPRPRRGREINHRIPWQPSKHKPHHRHEPPSPTDPETTINPSPTDSETTTNPSPNNHLH